MHCLRALLGVVLVSVLFTAGCQKTTPPITAPPADAPADVGEVASSAPQALSAPQTSSAEDDTNDLNLRLVTEEFTAAIIFHPSRLGNSPLLADAQTLVTAELFETFGLQTSDVKRITALFQLFPSDEQPIRGVGVFETFGPADTHTFAPRQWEDAQERSFEGRTYHVSESAAIKNNEFDEAWAGVALDDRTYLEGPESLVNKMIASSGVQTPLTERLRTLNLNCDLSGVIAVSPIRDHLDAVLGQAPLEQLPEELQAVRDLPSQVEWAVASIDTSQPPLVHVAVGTADDTAAAQVHSLANSGLNLARTMYGLMRESMMESLPQDSGQLVAQAIDSLLESVEVTASGNEVTVRLKDIPRLKDLKDHMIPLMASTMAPVQEADWALFSSDKHGFSVMFPAPPVEDEYQDEDDATVATFEAELGPTLYSVTVDEMDPVAAALGPAMYETIAAQFGDAVQMKRPIELDGRAAMELTLEMEEDGIPVHIVLRMFLVNNRLYQILVSTAPQFTAAPDMDTFFDSFALTDAKPASESASLTHTWTDSTGRFSITAELLGLDQGSLQLRKADGSTLAVPVGRLSAEDAEFAGLLAVRDQIPDEARFQSPGYVKTFRAMEDAVAWVRESNAFGPDHQLAEDARSFIEGNAELRRSYFYTFGPGLMKSGKCAVLACWSRTYFVVEIPASYAQSLGVEESGVRTETSTAKTLSHTVLPTVQLGAPIVVGARRLDGNRRLAGAVPYKVVGKAFGDLYALQMTVIGGGTLRRYQYLGDELNREGGLLPFSFDALNTGEIKYAGPIVLFFEVVIIYSQDDPTNADVESNTVATLVNVKTGDEAVTSGVEKDKLVEQREPAADHTSSSPSPNTDDRDRIWIQTKDDKYQFAVPAGSKNLTSPDDEPLSSAPEVPHRMDFVKLETPHGDQLLFQVTEKSGDISDEGVRAGMRGGLYPELAADEVSEGAVLKQGPHLAVQYLVKSSRDPFIMREGESFTTLVRVVQTDGKHYLLTVSTPSDLFGQERSEQILESFRPVSGAAASSNSP